MNIEAAFYEHLKIENCDLCEIGEKQKERLRDKFTHNLNCRDIYYTKDFLIFTNEEAYNNWRYYAGLEYVDSDFVHMLKTPNYYIAAYSGKESRVEDILEILIDMDKVADEEDQFVEEEAE